MEAWNFLVGRRFSLGTVISVSDETARVLRGDDEFRILIPELICEHFKAQDKADAAMSELLNSGDGVYRP